MTFTEHQQCIKYDNSNTASYNQGFIVPYTSTPIEVTAQLSTLATCKANALTTESKRTAVQTSLPYFSALWHVFRAVDNVIRYWIVHY